MPCGKRMAYAAVGGGLDAEPVIKLLGRKDNIQNWAPRLCRMLDCYTTSAWSILRSEGVWTLSQRLDSPSRKDSIQNQAPRLCGMPACHAASAWPMLLSEGVWTLNLRLDSLVGRGLNTKTGTPTLQNARLLCDKRMAYATV